MAYSSWALPPHAYTAATFVGPKRRSAKLHLPPQCRRCRASRFPSVLTLSPRVGSWQRAHRCHRTISRSGGKAHGRGFIHRATLRGSCPGIRRQRSPPPPLCATGVWRLAHRTRANPAAVARKTAA
jgi:hypothetical protein